LGAAVATLAAIDLKINYGANVEYVTFGSPRVGNKAFYTFFHSLIQGFRIVHAEDTVPHWPKAISYSGYHHVNFEVWYTTSQKYKVCNDSGEDATCSDSVYGDSIEDHLAYLGKSTGCNNDDGPQMAALAAL